MNKSYAYSTDGEYYEGEFASVDEALANALRNYSDWTNGGKPEEVYVGITTPGERPDIDVDFLLERMQENAESDDAGEWAETYLDNVTSQQREELQQILETEFDKWAKKYGHEPNWFIIKDAQKYVYTKDGKFIKSDNE